MRRHILPEISPNPSLPKRGIPPFCRRPKRASLRAGMLSEPEAGPEGERREGGKEGFRLQCPHNYGLTSNSFGLAIASPLFDNISVLWAYRQKITFCLLCDSAVIAKHFALSLIYTVRRGYGRICFTFL